MNFFEFVGVNDPEMVALKSDIEDTRARHIETKLVGKSLEEEIRWLEESLRYMTKEFRAITSEHVQLFLETLPEDKEHRREILIGAASFVATLIRSGSYDYFEKLLARLNRTR